jgi:hypothetical protein
VNGGGTGAIKDNEKDDISLASRELKHQYLHKKVGTFSNWEENTFEV